jgi:DMSO/TMAO reductase YedYZ molybdopterin-dependent catalytic subunit
MLPKNSLSRRRFFGRAAAAAALFLAGCDRLSSSEWFPKVLATGEDVNRAAQRLLGGRRSMAQEFSESDLSLEAEHRHQADRHDFRSNGTSSPNNARYQALAAGGFADYKLEVAGLVAKPTSFSLADLRALPGRTQITRHDCVEGWSAIGKWKGAKLSALLDAVGAKPQARYVVFYCADPMEANGTGFYYESIDMDDAYHVQTILAYDLNDHALPIKNGAPIRLRVERQLGYKHAKYIMRIELVSSFDKIAGGKGGYWEDNGYEWFAGI